MSVTSVQMIWTDRGATDTHLNHRTWRERYEILVDSVTDTRTEIGADPLVPQVGSVHAEDAGAVLTEFHLDVSGDSPLIWYADLTFDSKPELPQSYDPGDGAGGSEPGDGGTGITPAEVPVNPLERPAVWTVGFATTSEPVSEWYAYIGGGDISASTSLTVNTAGLPFNPPAMVDVSLPVLRVTKNIQSPPLAFYESLQGAVNDVAWKGLGKRVAKIGGVQGEGQYENGVSFVALTLEIMVNRRTWDLRLLNCGYSEKVEREDPDDPGGDPVIVHQKITDTQNQPIGEPVPLAADGTKLAADGTPIEVRGLPAQLHPADFATLLAFLDS